MIIPEQKQLNYPLAFVFSRMVIAMNKSRNLFRVQIDSGCRQKTSASHEKHDESIVNQSSHDGYVLKWTSTQEAPS